ncbi:MAG: bifunctional 23S rRNA (guanine(2069)-N(7))-methyltransferase RlmK/23S rRNA (guanine(2445)-N(2))-methyltransferase RlmL [Gammaproteobacteria bacterium]|nr:bifunctional 23S rRNA (guanine(2069)-N(7))-methyltransferase RlmK/23S rRNA (guanine(2445)-N(2))-methyltransferase RlmL [Gammaproteobacteria bacterium]
MTTLQKYFASCPKGVEDLLQKEIQQLGASNVSAAFSGVNFEGDLKTAYKVCLWSRIASRVLLPLKEFEATTEDELYKQVQSINWSLHLPMDGTLAVNCFINDSNISNSHYAALKVKDAIVDQFRELYEERPSVDRDRPNIRLNLHINKNQAILSLDLSGEALHKRGYRMTNVAAPLKENLAAAILMRSGWPNDKLTLVDLMCGSGTFLTEAAMMALHIAPGLRRDYFGFLGWKKHDAESWKSLLKEAHAIKENHSNQNLNIKGYDAAISSVKAAKQNVHAAGLQDVIDVEQRSVEECSDPVDSRPGLLVVNPPYGERLGDVRELAYLYSDLADCWKNHFSDWSVALFTGNLDLVKHIGLRAHKTNTLLNGAIKCKLFHYKIRPAQSAEVMQAIEQRDTESRTMIANRLKKNLKHLKRWANRNGIECYRVYDADLPEFSAAVDIYDDWVHVQEYQAPSSIDIRKARQRLDHLVAVIPEVLGVEREKVVVKTRRQQKGLAQYEKQASVGYQQTVNEGGLKFIVNLRDYLDTGLFLDHRDTREKVREWSKGKRFLNLFAYTGSVSVYAAAGGAVSTTTVDMSNTYLNWAKQNFELNGFTQSIHQFVKADCIQWLKTQQESAARYDLIFLDPPTFSNSKTMETVFDVQKDHVDLIKLALGLLDNKGTLVFSNNFRKFKLDPWVTRTYDVEEISKHTIPEDFKRNQKIHRCWIIKFRQ